MRPLRFLLTLAACLGGVILLLYVAASRTQSPEDAGERSTLGAYFNWRTPSSLFPPSAIISLTDDNSTFFLARPAAFGPLLPSKSLSAQLWVGSGFGDDKLGRGGSAAGSEGELGCSDVPGWQDGDYRSVVGSGPDQTNKVKSAKARKQGNAAQVEKPSKRRRDGAAEVEDDADDDTAEPEEDDGTDDYLHHPLPPSDGELSGNTKKPTHADIQSLQESAEIAGKVVLLSRGGCGFLEKVKWAQRRGGIALIVGDDIPGGPLVTMYARGDTSNVTIPSVFTSHTTAHLLSSLIPSGGLPDDLSPEDAARLGVALGGKAVAADLSRKADGRNYRTAEKPNFTTTTSAPKATSTSQSSRSKGNRKSPLADGEKTDAAKTEQAGWFTSVFGSASIDDRQEDSRRPPSSGNIDWVLQEDFYDEDNESEDPKVKTGKQATTSTTKQAPTKAPGGANSDSFVIGVQDWRDPDLMENKDTPKVASTSSQRSPQTSKAAHGPKGGSITPGSGEYGSRGGQPGDKVNMENHSLTKESTPEHKDTVKSKSSGGWLHKLNWSAKEDTKISTSTAKPDDRPSEPVTPPSKAESQHENPRGRHDMNEHEGLWVTLTPTSMSSSPFFDTLLVLVVSPLVTLTVVYALLLLRSRIRRRRWRAPKSVVERLPVRTYQTMPSTSLTSSRTSSITTTSSLPPTTPLLHSSARPIGQPRSRPRSRTASELPVQQSSSLRSVDSAQASLEHIEEKRAAGLAEWRRRYGGKQKECVVCLEEYVDGVSRVMSLPCGHEFHAECMRVYPTTSTKTSC